MAKYKRIYIHTHIGVQPQKEETINTHIEGKKTHFEWIYVLPFLYISSVFFLLFLFQLLSSGNSYILHLIVKRFAFTSSVSFTTAKSIYSNQFDLKGKKTVLLLYAVYISFIFFFSRSHIEQIHLNAMTLSQKMEPTTTYCNNCLFFLARIWMCSVYLLFVIHHLVFHFVDDRIILVFFVACWWARG